MHGPIYDVYRRIRRNRVLEIRFLEKEDLGLSIIRRRSETIDLQVDDGRVRVEMAADDECLATLLEELVASGVRMHSFAEKDPTLEDVFMLVTKGLVA